jgi:adenylate cyclase
MCWTHPGAVAGRNLENMDQAGQATVLFADISGSTKLYESEGDKVAMEAIAHCLGQLRQSVETAGGRVVKTIGDEIMAVFTGIDAAATAAGGMQSAVEALPAVGATRLGLRIGLHCGPVIQSDNDVFGDTVNLAARMVEQAGRGQIIMSRETADQLGPLFRAFKRQLYAIHVKGKAGDVVLCELIWRHSDDMTMSVSASAPVVRDAPSASLLRLKYRDIEVTCQREHAAISMGRGQDCSLVIATDRASRKHCTIEQRRDQFYIADQSTNGTYVSSDGGPEILLRREELSLGAHGWISLGQPRSEATDVVEFSCA